MVESMSKKRLNVEFRFFDRNTCSRCRTTDKNVEKTLRDLREALAEAGVGVKLKTTKLPASRLSESNSILINGKDVGELISYVLLSSGEELDLLRRDVGLYPEAIVLVLRGTSSP